MDKKQLSAWDRVLIARKSERPKSLDYINQIFTNFIELHGDRAFGDDKSIVGGIAELNGIPVTVIGEQKGKTAKENIEKSKEVKKYLAEEYYKNIIKEEKVDATLKHNSNPHSKVTNSKTTSANKKKEKLSLSTISSKKK